MNIQSNSTTTSVTLPGNYFFVPLPNETKVPLLFPGQAMNDEQWWVMLDPLIALADLLAETPADEVSKNGVLRIMQRVEDETLRRYVLILLNDARYRAAFFEALSDDRCTLSFVGSRAAMGIFLADVVWQSYPHWSDEVREIAQVASLLFWLKPVNQSECPAVCVTYQQQAESMLQNEWLFAYAKLVEEVK